jgi:polysaccharide export outer membrane protein
MRFLQRSVRLLIAIAGLAASTLLWVGCDTPSELPPPLPNYTNAAMIPLQIGDQVFVDLTGTPSVIPQSSFTLSGAGTINLPLLDTNIPALGKSPHELEQIIKDLYVPKVFAIIAVNVTPGPRYYYVSGCVNNPGKQLYTGNVTILGAVAAAGGFNDYAARKRVQLTRQDNKIYKVDCKKALKDPAKWDLEVIPGDRIYADKQTPWEAMTGQ